jgi:hypothetical protein
VQIFLDYLFARHFDILLGLPAGALPHPVNSARAASSDTR